MNPNSVHTVIINDDIYGKYKSSAGIQLVLPSNP